MATIEERTTDDGKTHFRVKIRLRGQPAQTATFARKSDAKTWAQQTEAAIKEGRYFKTTEARRHTFGELIDRYLELVMPRKEKSEEAQRPQLLWWKSSSAPMPWWT